jgi:protein-tyrosine phosphatase
MKILMVCLGNICRSPLAEGILKQKIEKQGLPWTVHSAGTGHWHIGEEPDSRSVAIAREYDIDISGQRARQINPEDFDYYDLILTMDQSNYTDVLRLTSTENQRDKVEMIMNLAYPGSNMSVPDPYWDDDGFERVFRMLEQAVDRLIERYN